MVDSKENYKFYLGVKGLNKLQTTTQASESWCFGINFLKKLCVQKSRVFLFPTFFFYRFQFSFVYFLRPVVSYVFMWNYAREIGSLAAEINASHMPHVFSLFTRRFVFPCEQVAWRVKQRVGTDTTRKSNIRFFPVLIINVIFEKTKAIVEIRIT